MGDLEKYKLKENFFVFQLIHINNVRNKRLNENYIQSIRVNTK